MAGEMEFTDVCIIGAGPAGAAASLVLSQHHIPHTLVDSATFPRHKPCGDIITSGVLRVLNDLDVHILQTLKEKNYLNPVWHTLTYPPNGKPIAIDFLPFDRRPGEPSCYSVSRLHLDSVLLSKVEETRYADVRQNCRIVHVENGSDGIKLGTESGNFILAKLVIVATGSNNNILKHFGLSVPKKDCAIGIRAHYEGLDFKPDETGLFLDSNLMPGGLYVTPLPNNQFNVNLVVSLDKVAKENLNLREKFDAVIEANPILKAKFSKARRLGGFEGSMLFLGLRKRIISGDRFLVVGDSAGLIEFFSGNGIPQALISGKIAALQAIKALQNQDFSKESLGSFDEALYKKINQSLTTSRVMYPILHSRFLSNVMLRFLNYLSGRPKTNALLRDLLYQKDPGKTLRNPRFYYDLLLKKQD